MDDQMTREAVQEQSVDFAHEQGEERSFEEQISQQSAASERSLNGADCNLDYHSGNLANDVDSSMGEDLGSDVNECFEANQEAVQNAQQDSQRFFDQIRNALDTANPQDAAKLAQLGQEASDAAKRYAVEIDSAGRDLSNETCYALDNNDRDALQRALKDATRAAADATERFDRTMEDLNERFEELGVEIADLTQEASPERERAEETSKDRDLLEDDRELTDADMDRLFEQAEATGKGLQERPIELNIDEKQAVNENDISEEERMRRAMDLVNNRDFKDSTTNQATKNNYVDQSLNRRQENGSEVSVKQDPSALITRDWKNIQEMREICEHVLDRANLDGKNADQVKEALNRGIREEIKNPTTDAGKAVNEALREIMHKQENENDFFRKRRR